MAEAEGDEEDEEEEEEAEEEEDKARLPLASAKSECRVLKLLEYMSHCQDFLIGRLCLHGIGSLSKASYTKF